MFHFRLFLISECGWYPPLDGDQDKMAAMNEKRTFLYQPWAIHTHRRKRAAHFGSHKQMKAVSRNATWRSSYKFPPRHRKSPHCKARPCSHHHLDDHNRSIVIDPLLVRVNVLLCSVAVFQVHSHIICSSSI